MRLFLWGYVKSCVYVNNPRTIPQLKKEITRVMAQIQAEVCTGVDENFVHGVDVCRRSPGGHIPDILFHV